MSKRGDLNRFERWFSRHPYLGPVTVSGTAGLFGGVISALIRIGLGIG